MGQRRVCSYFHSRCKHSSPTPITFWSLPQDIRDTIYRYSDILCGAVLLIGADDELKLPVCYEYGGREVFYYEEELAPYWEADLDNYNDMRWLSSDFDADMTRYMFSKNEIYLVYDSAQENLRTFLRYSNQEICGIERLSVLLHRDYEVKHYEYCVSEPDTAQFNRLRSWYEPHDLRTNSLDEEKFKSTVPEYQKRDRFFVTYWRLFVERLRECKGLPRLHLRVAFDAFDSVLIEMLLKMLEGLNIGQLTVQIEQSLGAAFAARVEQAIVSITAAERRTWQPFRFLDLPPELRSHILGLAGLINPQGKITVHPCDISKDPHSPGGWTFEEACTAEFWCMRHEFCSITIGSVHPHCGCWEVPQSLFLICRQLWQEATHVLYSQNRIIFAQHLHHVGCIRSQSPLSQWVDFLNRFLSIQALSATREFELVLRWRPEDKYQISSDICEDLGPVIQRLNR